METITDIKTNIYLKVKSNSKSIKDSRKVVNKNAKILSDKHNLMKFAGILNDDDAVELMNNIADCRIINLDDWN